MDYKELKPGEFYYVTYIPTPKYVYIIKRREVGDERGDDIYCSATKEDSVIMSRSDFNNHQYNFREATEEEKGLLEMVIEANGKAIDKKAYYKNLEKKKNHDNYEVY